MEHIIQELQVQNKLKEELDQIMTSAKHINQQLSQVQRLASLSGGERQVSRWLKNTRYCQKPGISKEALSSHAANAR